MGLFSQHAGNQGKHSVTTVIAQGCTINGNLRLSCDLQIDGYIEGKIVSEKTLVISVGGRIKGELTADKVIINGMFEGECFANSVEILPQGKAHGTIHCDDLSIERGGSFIGKTLPASAEQVISLPKSDSPEDKILANKSADQA
ncbi:bactofilin family protein [Rheinheimera maricola]|uniref:Polymer-forming cytoskeletal protein n=1 Tax=Rheinheimera maricola TaxID=2793282 RepID=A0ABS7X3Y4_9GAMM|nr:polymer-forming cytoskeletal protein [Rheinheimera maricola]MBZ9610011.1 polymer-forming cytoskeletal protein [Rheinheimera maricola]